MTDFENMTPEQLRSEADRRELIQRHLDVQTRRVAREELAKIIADIPSDIIVKSGHRETMTEVLKALVNADDKERVVSNGDIMLVSHGQDHTWWQEATRDHPRVGYDTILGKVKRGRFLFWRDQS